jgi:hypothetical protein
MVKVPGTRTHEGGLDRTLGKDSGAPVGGTAKTEHRLGANATSCDVHRIMHGKSSRKMYISTDNADASGCRKAYIRSAPGTEPRSGVFG